MKENNNFANKQILIAGAGAGIGKTTAITLSELGANLTLIDNDDNELVNTMQSLNQGNHHSFQFDMSNIEDIEEKVKEIVKITGPLDGFVYCVGIRSRRPLSLLTPKILGDVMNLNFFAFLEMVRHISKRNNHNSGLSIVSISSIAALRGGAGVTAYAASKGAMESAVRCLAKELAPKKIRINTVVPAQINTPAYADLIKMGTVDDDPTLSRQYLGLGETQDIANIITFLLNTESRFITGSAIPADGGFLTS